MDEFWNGIIYKNPEAKHVCEDFGVVLVCNGEKDFMICQKCGKGWVTLCSIKGNAKEQKITKRFRTR